MGAAHGAEPRRPGRANLAPVPRLALTREEAGASIGMSLDSFERHVQPTIRLVRLGRKRLVPVAELERWLDAHAEHPFDPPRRERRMGS